MDSTIMFHETNPSHTSFKNIAFKFSELSTFPWQNHERMEGLDLKWASAGIAKVEGTTDVTLAAANSSSDSNLT